MSQKDMFGEALQEISGPLKTLLLKFLGTVAIAATTEKFVAKEKFKVDTSDALLAKISYIDDNFYDFFLTGEGKVEEPIGETVLSYAKLKKDSVDGPIINKLGGEEQAKTTLGEIYVLMAMQPNGEEGVLLTNGKANIFYIRDTKMVLRAVIVYWRDDGWHVGAYSVEDPIRWHEGRQVFSRNPKP